MTAIFKDTFTDLRDKKLWPLAVVLVAALVAVPLLLTKSSKPAPVASAPTPSVPAAPGLPVVSAQSAPTRSHLTGPSRDPFGGAGSTASTTTSTTSSTSGSSASNATSASQTGGTSAGGASSSPVTGASPTSTSTVTPIVLPPGTPKPKPAPPTLGSTQSYEVSLAITNGSGGLNTIDPLERLSVLPNDGNALLVDLGVLKGGHRVLFAVQPGAVVSGPGICIPGPIDCEILSLAVGQTEGLSERTGSGASQVALMAVTSVTAVGHGSSAAALKARRKEDAAGRAILNRSSLSALSLFRYQPSLGTVVDLRNLQVGS